MSTRHEQAAEHSSAGRLTVSWALVSIPLAYGLYETILTVADLFTG